MVSLLLSGKKIDRGKKTHVHHKCRTRNCVRPSHLEVVTAKQNIVDFGTGLTALNARKTHCPKNHPLTIDNIKKHHWEKYGYRICIICDRAGKRKKK